MKYFDWDQTWVGLLIGFFTPIIVYLLYYFFVYDTGLRSVNVSLCVASNLIPFYLYQKREKFNGLKGVLISTFVWAGVVVVLSFFTNYLRIG
jgi:hypothetical protein